MDKFKSSFLIALFFMWSPLVQAKKGTELKTQVESKKPICLEQELKKVVLSSRRVGVIVANSHKILYEQNADKSFIPASLVKIFTASALLELLSPSLKFSTRFQAKDKIVDSVLKGDLYLKGGGDPTFVSESLWNLVNNLVRTGVKQVQGNLVVDDSLFDKQRRGPRLSVKGSHIGYDSPVGALSFNWNIANLYFRPQKKGALQVNVDPSSAYFVSVDNRTQTGKGKIKNEIFIQRREHKKQKRESLTITGSLPSTYPEVLIYRNILYPAIWTGYNTKEFLKQRGIRVEGGVQRGFVPKTATVLAEWKGRPLVEQVRLMMKFSNNFMVEMLLKNMVVELKQKKGNLKEGISILKKHIRSLGVLDKEYRLVQASGLSRENKVRPRALWKVLKYWLHHPLQPEFESAFPLSGLDGTLKRQFKNSALKGRIHAKTGSLNGVSGLAGYVVPSNGKKRIFVLLFNGPQSQKAKTEKKFQQWAKIVYEAPLCGEKSREKK